jgi:hypothetical protein
VHKESPNPAGLNLRIKQWVFFFFALVAAVQGVSFAPASAPHHMAVYFRYVVSLVRNQLSIYAKHVLERAIDLLRRVVADTQVPNRLLNKLI